MADIKIGMDVSKTSEAARQLVNDLKSMKEAGAELGAELASFNAKGKALQVVMRGMSDDGKKFTAVYKEVKGELKLVKQVFEETETAAKKYQQATRERAQQQKQAYQEEVRAAEQALAARQRLAAETRAEFQRQLTARTADSTLRGVFSPVSLDANTVGAFESRIAQIKAILASGKVSINEFNQLVATIGRNPSAALIGLSADAARLANLIRQLTPAYQQSNQAAKELGNTGERLIISFGSLLRLFESQVIRNFFAAFISEVKNSQTLAAEFSVKIAEIQTISQKANITTDQWANSIRDLSAKFGAPQIDVAEGAYQALSNQIAKSSDQTVRARTTLDFLNDSLNFSLATVTSSKNAVNLLSSAINSFGLSTANTEAIAASFFKTIDLGRVRADDLANTYGRVASVAKTLGLSFNELNAAIATITIQGVTPSDANTFISNLLLKLANPTEAMIKLFKEWGVATGQAAIATFGFEGVLKKLDQEFAKGASVIQADLGNIRAFRGGVLLAGQGVNVFSENLRKISDAVPEYQKSITIVRDSLGKEFQIELNKVKIFFEKDFGQTIISKVVAVSKVFGGLDNAVKTLGITIGIGTTAYILYRTILSQVTAAMIANQAAAAGATASTTALGVAATQAAARNAALIASLRLTALVGAGIAANFLVGKALGGGFDVSESKDKGLSDIQKRDSQIEESNKERINKLKQEEVKFSQDFENQIKRRFSRVLEFTTQVIKKATEIRDIQSQYLKQIKDEAAVTAKTFVDSLTRGLNEIEQKISESINNIKESQKQLQNLPFKAEELSFQSKQKFTDDPFQQLQLFDTRIAQLREQATALAKQGTKDSIDEARRLFDEIQNLTTQRFDKETEFRRRKFDEDVKAGKVLGTLGFDGKERFQFTVNTAEYEARIFSIAQERIQIEKQFQAEQKKEQAGLIKQKELEKARLNEIQDLLKKAAEFDVRDATGNVKKKFTGEGTLNAQQASLRAGNEFEGIINKIRSLTTDEEKKNFQIFADLERQRRAIIQETESIIREEKAKTTQQELINSQGGALKRKADLERQLSEAREAAKIRRQDAEAQLKVLEDIANVGRSKIPLTTEGLREEEAIRLASGAKSKTLDAIQQAREAGRALVTNETVENARKFREAMEQAVFAAARFVELRTTNITDKGLKDVVVDRDTGVDATVTFRNILQKATEAQQSVNKIGEAAAALQKGKEDVQKFGLGFDELNIKVGSVAEASALAKARIVDDFQQVGTVITAVVTQIQNLKNELNTLGGNLPPVGNQNIIQRARGGIVGFANGGLASTDTIPAMLSPGEFIMNAKQTAKFLPLLQALNSGSIKGYASGGQVSNNTTVGDINISVQGGQTSDATIREVADKLRRGIKRGSIRLQ